MFVRNWMSCPHTWLLPFVIASRPSVDMDEDGRGRVPTGVVGCGWLTCEPISSDSHRSSSSLTSLSICSLWVSVSRPRRSSWKHKHVTVNLDLLEIQHTALCIAKADNVHTRAKIPNCDPMIGHLGVSSIHFLCLLLLRAFVVSMTGYTNYLAYKYGSICSFYY